MDGKGGRIWFAASRVPSHDFNGFITSFVLLQLHADEFWIDLLLSIFLTDDQLERRKHFHTATGLRLRRWGRRNESQDLKTEKSSKDSGITLCANLGSSKVIRYLESEMGGKRKERNERRQINTEMLVQQEYINNHQGVNNNIKSSALRGHDAKEDAFGHNSQNDNKKRSKPGTILQRVK